jgi:tRNA threonylcarbamoyladenosine biosynthesis protein TsaB
MLPLDPTCLLALDTATEVVHLALWVRGQCHARALAGGAQASATTLPALQTLLSEAGLTWADVDGLAFGRGPGAFTGLRTACSITQGLALGLDKPVLALDTLMAVAESARQQSSELAQALQATPSPKLWVLQDARMSEVYAAAYTWDDSAQAWHSASAPQLWPLAHLKAQVDGGEVILAAGSALTAYPACFEGLKGPGVPQACPEGSALARLALQAWQRGEQIDAALALPLYVRDKVAQTTAERQKAA